MNQSFTPEEKEQAEFIWSQIEQMEKNILKKYKASPTLMVDALVNKVVSFIKIHAPSRSAGLGFLLDSLTQTIHSVYDEKDDDD